MGRPMDADSGANRGGWCIRGRPLVALIGAMPHTMSNLH